MGVDMKQKWKLFRVERIAWCHTFLLPQTIPLLISASIRGKSVSCAHAGVCCSAYVSNARTTAELPTVQPKTSEAVWLRFRKVRSFSAVSEWVRMVSGSFLERAISELLTQYAHERESVRAQ